MLSDKEAEQQDDGENNDSYDADDALTVQARKYLTEADWQELEKSISDSPDDAEIDAYNERVRDVVAMRKKEVLSEKDAENEEEEDEMDENETDGDEDETDQSEDGEEAGGQVAVQNRKRSSTEEEDASAVVALEDGEVEKRWRTTFADMDKEIKQLRKKVKELNEENTRVNTAFDHMTRRFAAAPTSALVQSQHRPQVLLHQIYELPQGSRLQDIAPGHRFSYYGAFPHGVAISKQTKLKEYQVSKARKLVLKFNLAMACDLTRANEHDVCAGGLLSFQMNVFYADKPDDAVGVNDFSRAGIDSITTHEASRTKSIVNGELHFTFNFVVCSRDTNPAHRAFVIKVWPVDEVLQREQPGLTVFTEPFVVRAKVLGS